MQELSIVVVVFWLVIGGLWLVVDRDSVLASPATTFAAYNAFFSAMALLLDGEYPIYAAGLAWIAVATLAFRIGFGSLPAPTAELATPAPLPPRHELWVACLGLAAVGLVGVLLLNTSTVDAITSGGDLQRIAEEVAVNLVLNYEQYESGQFVRTVPHMLLAFVYASATLAGLLHGMYPSKRVTALAIGFVVPLIAVFLSGARTILTVSFVMYCGTLIAGSIYRTHTSSIKPVSIALGVVTLVAIVTIAYFWRWGNLDELASGNLLDRVVLAWNTIEHGGFAPIPQFSQWLEFDWSVDDPLSWGARVFRGPAGLLGSYFGFEVPRVFESWTIGRQLVESNIFSIHRPVIEDFGLLSILIFVAAGSWARSWHRRVIDGSMLSAVALGAVYTTIFMSAIDFPYASTVTLAAVPLTLVTIIAADRIARSLAAVESNLPAQ